MIRATASAVMRPIMLQTIASTIDFSTPWRMASRNCGPAEWPTAYRNNKHRKDFVMPET